MPTKTYLCTRDQFATLQTSLEVHGIVVTSVDPNNGSFSDEGVTLGFSYDGTANLTITILKKGFLPTAAMVWDALDEYVNPPASA
jgi:NAD(P)H-hydrate repair Nnr-like enzyme with NAD(P)H-hydrate epimerase domain